MGIIVAGISLAEENKSTLDNILEVKGNKSTLDNILEVKCLVAMYFIDNILEMKCEEVMHFIRCREIDIKSRYVKWGINKWT